MKQKHSEKNSEPDPRGEEEALSRRERQIMDAVYEKGSATARDIWHRLPDAPTYATVRTILRVLLEKKHLTFRKEGRTYIYSPVRQRDQAGGQHRPAEDMEARVTHARCSRTGRWA